MKLIIVESPNKCHTISKYLNNKYEVIATKGHIRDLAISGKGGLGVDCENNFTPHYEILKDKKNIVKEIKNKVKKSDEVFLATDPDREGEAIAWHVSEVFNLPKDNKRLEFHEITKKAIQDSLKQPRVIDLNLVASQETRRILDRILGFKLSKILQKTNNLKSAGRVQSAVLKLIIDREKTIKNFKSEKYWEITAVINTNNNNFNTSFYEYKNKKIKLTNKDVVDDIVKKTDKKIKIIDIKEKIISTKSKPPLITSTLQQEAITKFNMPSFKVNKIAQELYEGIKIKNELIGLITYIRTDSQRLNDAYIEKTKNFISKKFGKEFVAKNQKQTKIKKKNIQDAHEAIRPTDNNLTPEKIKSFLTEEQYKIYKLIYEKTFASLMSEKKEQITDYIIGNDFVTYKISKTKIIFPGFEKIFDNIKNQSKEENQNFNGNIGDVLKIIKINIDEKDTKPPSRFSEASIIKAMEKEGIGRPSTYSSTITTLLNRLYIIKENGAICPTKDGHTVIEFLENKFPDIVNVKFTAILENDLDKVKNGTNSKNNIINKIYIPFIQCCKKIENEEIGICPECGNKLKNIHGKNGYFIGCSNYPKCKFKKTINNNNNEILDRKCPECGSFLVKKLSYKRKKYFIGCSNYPKCKFIETNKNKNVVK